MNYKKHYDYLIKRGIERNISGIFEIHHIVPKCLGGSDDKSNLVKLTPEEHFIAHQLLVKIYPGNNKLIYALALMSGKGTDNYIRNNKLYGWIRKKLSVGKSEQHRRKISTAMMGKKKSEDHKRKISKALLGRSKCPMSEEQKLKISLSLSGRKGPKCSEEKKNKIGKSNKGKNSKIYTCDKCGKSGKGSVMFRYHFDRCVAEFKN